MPLVHPLNRRGALIAIPSAGLAAMGMGAAAGARPVSARPAAADGDFPGFPRQDPAWARETVGASHRDLGRVRELVEAHPALANAGWDWGFGDWETPLGAAAHTGRREIAEYLIAKGARPDLFAAAMLGWLDAVKAMLAASPGVQRTPGPHGITLLAHARAGGEAAAAVVAYLEGIDDADAKPVTIPLEDDERARFLGEFAWGPGTTERFAIVETRGGGLSLRPAEGSELRLLRVGDATFHPTGAPAVRVVFRMEGDRALTSGVTITDGDRVVTAAPTSQR